MNFMVDRRMAAFFSTLNFLSPYKRRLANSLGGENNISTSLVIWTVELNSTMRGRLCKSYRNKKCSLSSFSIVHLHNGEVQLKFRRKRYSLRSLNSTRRRVSNVMPYLSLIPYVSFFGVLIIFRILDLNLSIFVDWRISSSKSFQWSAQNGKKEFLYRWVQFWRRGSFLIHFHRYKGVLLFTILQYWQNY